MPLARVLSLRRSSTWLATVVVCFATARACGPFFDEAVFVKLHGPDLPYAHYAAGNLGVPRPEYRVRHLVLAFDWMSGRGLSPDEQHAAAQADKHLLNNGGAADDTSGYAAWLAATAKTLAPAKAETPGSNTPASLPERSLPGQPYTDFTNCLDGAFAIAANILTIRGQTYGATALAVADWLRGQQVVFSNCGDRPADFSNGQYRSPTPPPAVLPSPAGPDAPTWLRHDRAYQVAAAEFYALNFDKALTDFKAIAADAASPWSATAEYMTARTLLRKATLVDAAVSNNPKPGEIAAAEKAGKAGLLAARQQLLSIRHEPRLQPFAHSIDGLLDYVAARLDPAGQRKVLAERLSGQSPDPSFYQDLVDITAVSSSLRTHTDEMTPHAEAPPVPHAKLGMSTSRAHGLLAWLDTFGSMPKEADSLANWRAAKDLHAPGGSAWLLAAMQSALPGDPAVPALLQSAASVTAADPAYTAITFHRFRLMPPDAATRTQLNAAIATLPAWQSVSTRNLFASLQNVVAPDLTSWLQTAGRVPAATNDGDDDDVDLAAPDPATPEKPQDQPCGPALLPSQTRLFTPSAADALNTRMPLNVLARAAEQTVLPPNLRFELAQSAWTRAVLLDRPEVAARLTPILVGCRSAWKPVLAAYDQAKSPDERHVAGLLALMRFASTEPNVRSGEPRPEGFATYSVLRDNWWLDTVARTATLNHAAANFSGTSSADAQPADQTSSDRDPADQANSLFTSAPLLFLTPADQAQSKQEIDLLGKIPPASVYFPAEALEWVKEHPHNPANSDLLGEAFRVARNAPTTKQTDEHSLFEILHRDYPDSVWAKRYTAWD